MISNQTFPMQRYNIYILTYDGKTKVYWNRMLQAWVNNKGSASPYAGDYGDQPFESFVGTFGMKVEKE